MLHKITEYKTDRVSKYRILKMNVVIMKGHNDFTQQLLLHLSNNHSKFRWQQ